MSTQRLSLAYFKRCHSVLTAWIRQLGKATWFFTLTMAEGHWVDLLRILYILKNGRDNVPTDEELLNMSFKEKSQLIKSNAVALARHWDKKLRYLHREVIYGILRPLGHVVDHVGCVEAQYRGSLHIHELLFCKDAPCIDIDDDQTVCDFVDRHVSCASRLPDIPGVKLTEVDRRLPEKLQVHNHRTSCRKGKKGACRFGIPYAPCPTTTIIRPLVGVPETELARLRSVYKNIAEELEAALKRGVDIGFDEFLQTCGLGEQYLSDSFYFV